MQKIKSKEDILLEYKRKSDELINQMQQLVIRVARIADDQNYRNTLTILKTIEKSNG